MKLFIVLILCYSTSALSANEKEKFFANFSQFCGKSFVGKAVFPEKPAAPFDQALLLTFDQCSEKEIKVPFKVGLDTSRTWVLSKTPGGLQLKHDHRHKDGTPHEVTLYGGIADNTGSPLKQSFPADSLTKKLVPEGVTNVWTITIDLEKNTINYNLERHSLPRFEAMFHMDTPDR